MKSAYEIGREACEKWVASTKSIKTDENEAQTRLLWIDELFFGCLGWDKAADVEVEEHLEGEYADYIFKLTHKCLVVEAKRSGEYFELPAGKLNLEYSLKRLCEDNKNVKAAVKQAAEYAQARGIPIAVVCNGHQLIAFVATRSDGIPPLEGKALVFVAPEQALDSFFDLWQSLSKDGVAEQHLQRRLLATSNIAIPPKMSARIPGYPGVKGRNTYQTNLQILSELVLEDVVKIEDLEGEFLKRCYCSGGALPQYSLSAREVLKDRYAALVSSSDLSPTIEEAATKSGPSKKIVGEVGKRPILLIGDVGAGKTTFVRYIMKVAAADILKDAYPIYIDLGSRATLTSQLADVIIGEIERQIKDVHQINVNSNNFVCDVYKKELKEFDEGIYGQLKGVDDAEYAKERVKALANLLGKKEEHLRRSLERIVKSHRKQVVVFIDNVDQRLEDLEEKTFLIAHELAVHWPLTVFVSLRPESFHSSQQSGVLSGYHPKAFAIAPPRVDHVVTKRLEFALDITRGKYPISALRAEVTLTSLESLISAFLHTMIKSEDIPACLENITGGNIRAALDLVRDFFGSGHVDTEKIVRKHYSSQGGYDIPIHEFHRAIIFGDSSYYDPLRSIVANLYDIQGISSKDHFTLPIILALASSLGAGNSGFVDYSTVTEVMQGAGYAPEQIATAMIRGCQKKLLTPSPRAIPTPQQLPEQLRATSVGLYHIQRLSKRFEYLDAIVVDTPILEKSHRELIADVDDIRSRLDRGEVFRQYLDSQWQAAKVHLAAYDWQPVSQALRQHIAAIRLRLEAPKPAGS